MQYYIVSSGVLRGTNFPEIRKKAFAHYNAIRRTSRRKPYIRSAYFNKEKIFLDLFWAHLFEKINYWDKIRRMRYFPCALELISKSRMPPVSKENPNKPSEILHRFGGMTTTKEIFFVQIKEEKRSGKKWFISVFPLDKKASR